MTFLNFMLLGGSAAAGIPLAIHLLKRSNPRIVRWGAMQFLEPKTRKQHRRLELRQLLLLLLRISAPVILALCMARPVLSSFPANHDGSPESLVLVLDDSASMSSAPEGVSSFEKAREAARKLIGDLPRGSEVSILSASSPEQPIVARTLNLNRAIELLAQTRTRASSAFFSEAVETAARVLSGMHHAKRRLILLSDFQKTNWRAGSADAITQTILRIQNNPTPPAIALFNAGPPNPQNIAVESLQFPELPVGRNQKISIRATIRNFGSARRPDIHLQWKCDGALQSSNIMTLGPHESGQIIFEHRFETAGLHHIAIETAHDGLTDDDSMTACIQVRERIPLTLVNGNPSTEPLQGETDFLELALNPSASGRRDAEGLFNPKVIPVEALNAKVLSKTEVVVLANVSRLAEQQLQALEEFVKAGGGLIVFSGSKAEPQWYNTQLYKGGRGLLPAGIESLRTRLGDGSDAGDREAYSVMVAQEHHSILEPFGRDASALDEVRVRTWHVLRLPTEGTSDNGYISASTVLALENGDPLLLERRFGKGIVFQCAIPCSGEWSNLPTRPAFLPLVQKMAAHASAAAKPKLNLTTGDPISIALPQEKAEQSFTLIRPEGTLSKLMPVERRESTLLEYAETKEPGLYRFESEDGDAYHFALNLSRGESDPEVLSEPEIAAIAALWRADVTRTARELVAAKQTAAKGLEIWRSLLWATLALLFLEILLQQRFQPKGEVQR